MRTCDPKSFVSVGTAAPDPPTWLFVTYMSAQEQSNKLEAIAIRGFIIFPATVWSSQEPDGSRGFRNATIVPQKRENCPLLQDLEGVRRPESGSRIAYYKDGTQQHYNCVDESSWMALSDFRLALGSQAFA